MPLTQVSSQMIGGNNSTIPTTTGLGNGALNSNTGGNNTAVGYQAGYSNTTATRNTLVGQIAGYALTTGSAHAVLGDNALKAATTAEGCVAVGTYALAAANGTHNTAVGAGSGELITTGTKNSILGRYNGNQGGLDIRTADRYVVLSDGDGNPRAYHNGFYWYLNSAGGIGYNQSSNATLGIFGASNFDSVNNGAVYNIEWLMSGNAGGQYWYANYLTRGGSRTLGAYCTGTSWTNSSDAANKENVSTLKYGLETVMAARPVDFDWKTQRDADGKGFSDIGFIAQEMELLIPEVVTGQEGSKGISYGNLVAVAFKAIQEQQAIITDLKARIEVLEAGNTPEPADE